MLLGWKAQVLSHYNTL